MSFNEFFKDFKILQEKRKKIFKIVLILNYLRAPQDCVQYFTGTAGTIQSYGWAGAQLLAGMDYNNCIRYFGGK